MRRAIYCAILGAVWLAGFVLMIDYLTAVSNGLYVHGLMLITGGSITAIATVALAEEAAEAL